MYTLVDEKTARQQLGEQVLKRDLDQVETITANEYSVVVIAACFPRSLRGKLRRIHIERLPEGDNVVILYRFPVRRPERSVIVSRNPRRSLFEPSSFTVDVSEGDVDLRSELTAVPIRRWCH